MRVLVLVQCRCSVHRRVGRSCCALLLLLLHLPHGNQENAPKGGIGSLPGRAQGRGEQGPWCWDLGSGLSDWPQIPAIRSHCVATSRIRWVCETPDHTPSSLFLFFFWATLDTGRISDATQALGEHSPFFEA